MKLPYGWICPKCGRVYAPAVSECLACNQAHTPPAEVTTIAAPMVPGPKEYKHGS